jgi:hypothetical protein
MIFLRGGIGMYILFDTFFLIDTSFLIYSQIFPSYSSARRAVCKNSALARIKAKRSEMRALDNQN